MLGLSTEPIHIRIYSNQDIKCYFHATAIFTSCKKRHMSAQLFFYFFYQDLREKKWASFNKFFIESKWEIKKYRKQKGTVENL